jgi:signal transduction histidine kinase
LLEFKNGKVSKFILHVSNFSLPEFSELYCIYKCLIQYLYFHHQTVCSIIDEGRGFSALALENQFQLFATGSEHINGNKGLSLALVKLIMDLHNGQIEVENNPTSGATVRLIFPN